MTEEKKCLVDGSPITDDFNELKENGQQKDYIVLCPEERLKGFIRPYRDSYIHSKCGTLTRMINEISETYARNPKFYGSTFCCGCMKHFPVSEFVWDGTKELVGS